ncbi:MAG: hypothetical protein PHD05_04490 [Sphaerochaetaceae bacterium]|nr:hypothetical protein [Sphaerochaetaceae bacterium]
MNNLKKLSFLSGITVKVNTLWLFRYSMHNNMNASDVIIRYLAIENYYGKNNNGFELYNNMMDARVKNREKLKGRNDNGVRFKELIKSFEEKGFDNDYPIQLNKYFLLGEGSHRLALALYFNVKEVPVCFLNQLNIVVDYSADWFDRVGLNEFRLIIENEYIRILKEKSSKYIVELSNLIPKSNLIHKKFYIEELKSEKKVYYLLYNLFPNEEVIYENDKKIIIDHNLKILDDLLFKYNGKIIDNEGNEADV